MIHLDTSYLIRAMVSRSRESATLVRWFEQRQTVRISSIAWAEFLCGPVSSAGVEDVAMMLGEPVAFGALDATLAALFFNASGRRRSSMADCMIAAAALNADAELATSNAVDFRRFARHGLVLATR